jgi:hypothetical protein
MESGQKRNLALIVVMASITLTTVSSTMTTLHLQRQRDQQMHLQHQIQMQQIQQMQQVQQLLLRKQPPAPPKVEPLPARQSVTTDAPKPPAKTVIIKPAASAEAPPK